jgi:hypothetical protein
LLGQRHRLVAVADLVNFGIAHMHPHAHSVDVANVEPQPGCTG